MVDPSPRLAVNQLACSRKKGYAVAEAGRAVSDGSEGCYINHDGKWAKH
jgi:hypothetical protein